MFIFVFWVLLEIFLPCTTTYDGCWLAGKTRGRKESCYGDLRQLNDAMARAAGTPPRTKVCLKHWRSIEKSDNRCSSTLSETHSPKLTSIPRGLYHYIDKQGGKIQKYRPGSKWCYKCWASCYKQPGLPVNERQKVTFTYEKCIKAHITIIPPQLSKTSKLNIVFIKYCRKTKKRNG